MSTLISVAEALAQLLAHRPDGGVIDCPLEAAQGRTLAAPLVARVSQPPLTVSAMDGYAVRLADVAAGNARLRLIGESPAGRPFDRPVGAGEAVRIFTGGALPDGADHVVIQEHATREDDHVRVGAPEAGPRHVRPAGLDFAAGDTLLAAGTRLGPAELAAAAAANHVSLPVRRPLSVALLANGDELKPPGAQLGPGEIIASSRYGLAGLVHDWGGVPMDLGIAPDEVGAIAARIEAGRAADILVPVGGASVGDHDHMRRALDGMGAETVFAKVAVRPGKPTWFARLGSQVVLGLPGNPASALVCAHLFLRPLLTGAPAPVITAALAAALPANGDRETYLRAALSAGEDGRLSLLPAGNQDSALIHPFLMANALIRQPPGAAAQPAGTPVEAVLIGPLQPPAPRPVATGTPA